MIRSAAFSSGAVLRVMIALRNGHSPGSFDAYQLTALKFAPFADCSSPNQYQVSSTFRKPPPCASIRFPAASFQKPPLRMVTAEPACGIAASGAGIEASDPPVPESGAL